VSAAAAADWLAEAWETGNPLAPFPPDLAPAGVAAGEAIAAELVERLGLPVCGVRLAPAPGGGWLSAPLLEPRMLRAGTPVALATMRHPRVSAGVLGVLGEPLEDEAPVFSALHPVLDIAAGRYRDVAADAAHLVADLAGLGLVLVGKRFTGPLPAEAAARVGRTGTRPAALAAPLGALMAQAAAEARRWGGLPAGAVLVVAGLGGVAQPAVPGKWSAAVPPVGRITAELA
jgi:hypothetical protein